MALAKPSPFISTPKRPEADPVLFVLFIAAAEAKARALTGARVELSVLVMTNATLTSADSTGLGATKPPISLKKTRGPTSKNRMATEIKTPKMHLSKRSVAVPSTLVVYETFPFFAQNISKWYYQSYQNWNISREVLLKVKSSRHLISTMKGRAP